MKMNTYVNFRGNCAEAFRYYEKHLGAKVGMMMTHAQSPELKPGRPTMEGRSAARAHFDWQ
jgi:PhnB protein